MFTTLCDRQSTGCISPIDGALVLNDLRRALGPLVKFPEGKVQLIHSTVKGYFLALHSEPDHPLHSTHGVDLNIAHLLLAKACIQNLLQQADSPNLLDEERSSSDMPLSSPNSVNPSEGEPDQDALFAELFNIEDTFLRDENIIQEDVLSHLRIRRLGYDYATWYWDHHYAQAEYLADASTQQDVIKLLSCGSPRLSRWYKYKANHSLAAMPDHSMISALVLAALLDYPITLRRLLASHNLANGKTDLQSGSYWASSRVHLHSIRVLLEYKSPLLDAGLNRSALAVAIQGGFTEVVVTSSLGPGPTRKSRCCSNPD